MNLEDLKKIQDIAQLSRSVIAYDRDGKMIDNYKEWIPEGTKEDVRKNGSIGWLDPITKCAYEFNDIHFRNGFIILNRDKGLFLSNKETVAKKFPTFVMNNTPYEIKELTTVMHSKQEKPPFHGEV